jgi:hypothetical protein
MPNRQETGPSAWLQRCCEKFDHLLSLDHKAASPKEYDEAFHTAVHALRDLRRFAETVTPGREWETEELVEVRKANREFRLAILKALGVTDTWAITTWRTVDYERAISRPLPGRKRETEPHIEELAKHTDTLRHVRECLIAGGFDGITLAAFDEAFGFFVKGEEDTKR